MANLLFPRVDGNITGVTTEGSRLSEHVEGKGAELQTALAEWHQKLKSTIDDRPQDFIRVLCHSVLEESSTSDLHPSPAFPGLRRVYQTPARLALQRLEETNFPPPQPEYISAKEWIEEEVRAGLYVDHVFYDHYQDARSHEDLWRELFEPVVDSLADAETRIALRVYHGVPIYQWNKKKFELVDESTEELGYLRQRGRRYEVLHSSTMPPWTNRLYLRSDHLRIYEAFYAVDYEQSEEEVNLLRAGYRHALGITPERRPPSTARQSRLMSLTEAVYERYYGANFSPADSDTWPRQKDIVLWLKQVHGLSEREAQAIDIVCRPDALRGK